MNASIAAVADPAHQGMNFEFSEEQRAIRLNHR